MCCEVREFCEGGEKDRWHGAYPGLLVSRCLMRLASREALEQTMARGTHQFGQTAASWRALLDPCWRFAQLLYPGLVPVCQR